MGAGRRGRGHRSGRPERLGGPGRTRALIVARKHAVAPNADDPIYGAAMAATWGLPGFRFLSTPHPIATLGGAQLHERAAQLSPLVVDLLRS